MTIKADTNWYPIKKLVIWRVKDNISPNNPVYTIYVGPEFLSTGDEPHLRALTLFIRDKEYWLFEMLGSPDCITHPQYISFAYWKKYDLTISFCELQEEPNGSLTYPDVKLPVKSRYSPVPSGNVTF